MLFRIRLFPYIHISAHYRFQLNIPTLADRLKLNSWLVIVPFVADYRWVIFSHILLNSHYRLTVIFFLERLALKHQVITFGQFNYVKAVRDFAAIIGRNFHTLNINRCTRLSVLLRKPKAYWLAAEGIHTPKHTPQIATHLFAVRKVFVCFFTTLDNNLSCRLVYLLNKYVSYIFHSQFFLSQFSEFYSVGNE